LGADLGDSILLAQLAMRPGVNSELIHRLLPEGIRRECKLSDVETALADSLYSGYIEKQRVASERVNHHDNLKVPESLKFSSISGLSGEMIERLERAQPRNFAQVRNIAGLTPAALSTVLVHLTSTSASAK
jgi:tRNA uridine 5-carboxymethylaminomethyl modification enzyme